MYNITRSGDTFIYSVILTCIMTTYKPRMAEEEIQKRKVWQEEVYNKLVSIREKREVSVLGKEFIVLPGMFAPIFEDSRIFAKAILGEVKPTDSVLDLGTGTGVQGIFAAQKAAKVLSVDINPKALECAKLNVNKHNLSNIEVRQSNLFSNVSEKFDLILFNPPYRWFKPRDMLERGELDENYETLNRFFSQTKQFLKKNGRILLVFSSSGDLKYVESLIQKYNFNSTIVKQSESDNWLYMVYKLF